jgi:hypothetical protein
VTTTRALYRCTSATLSSLPRSAIVSHSKPGSLRIRKSNPARLRLTRNLNPVRHCCTASRRVDHNLRSRSRIALKFYSAKQRLNTTGGRIDVDGAGARRGDRVAGGEIDFELAAVRASGNVGEG